MYKIECGALTADRKKQIAALDVPPLGRPLRLVLAAGGAYLFYYGTSPDVPDVVKGVAGIFAIVGIAAVLLAIFSQKLIEARYFAKAFKEGRFPNEVKAGEGGMAIIYKIPDKKTKGYTEKERFCFYSQMGKLEDHGKFLKLGLAVSDTGTGGEPFVYIFKEDFGDNPEAFVSFVESKRAGQ